MHLNSSVSSSSFISMATATIGELGGVIEQLSCCMALQWKNSDHPEIQQKLHKSTGTIVC